LAALSACSAALKPPVVEEGKAFPASSSARLRRTNGPASDGRRHYARTVGENVSGLAPAPAAALWLCFG
jgi:hypothetical protein